ncbi:MAG TPA: HAMP domain-containing sensor histidine kinase [Vicinamibacteria bacterium]|nr:HAMP domain-containing sensor histidine kinase [Vicinamibacteria bacterium]
MLGYLFPTIEEKEPRFRAEVARLSLLGLRVIGAICIGAPLAMLTMGLLWLPSYPGITGLWADLLFIAMGSLLVGLSFVPSLQAHARGLGVLSGFLSATLQTVGMQASADFHQATLHTTPDQHFPFTMTLVLLVGLAALPMKPVQTFGLGCAIVSLFAVTKYVANGPEALIGWEAFPIVLSLMMLLITTGLTVVLYHQRAFAFLARVRAEESFEALKNAQASLLLERNAASQSRFAAAMSHELGSPIGALASTFETLAHLVESALEKDSRQARAASEAIESGRSSYQRLIQVVDRMRSLTNLDRAEVQVVDVNTLCRDTVAFLEAELTSVHVELKLADVPPLRCRPDQLGTAISNLLRNAAAAVEHRGTIELRSGSKDGTVVIEIHDNGHGIEPERLERLFEPEFRIDRDRVTTTNWSLFVSRAIASEHRGRLELESAPGMGTTARLLLPFAA